MKKRNQSKPAQRRIGLLGGLFDPVHRGHLGLARAALSRLGLHTLYIVPANRPWHKRAPVLSAGRRLLLARRAFSGLRGVKVSDMEIRRGGVSYTYQTLERLKKRFCGEWYLIIGADNIREITGWKHAEKIFSLARIAVASRPPFPALSKLPAYRRRMEPLPVRPLEISSTELRRALKAGRDVSAWIPEKALQIILKKGWYRC